MSKLSYGDVINIGEHYVQKCVMITNIDDYPEVSLLGFVPTGVINYDTYVISSSQCLTKGYKYNDFNVFAVSKEYLAGKDIKKLDLPRDNNAIPSNIRIEPFGGYLNDSIPISATEQYYKIIGFTANSLVLFKWKEVNKFNNGKPDSTKTYDYEGDLSKLYQNLQVGIHSNRYLTSIELYPNPAQKNFHLKINNLYQGSVPIELVTMDGKIVKSLTLSKTGSVLDYDIRVENFDKGAYFLRLMFGEKVEFKKIIIK